MAAKDEAREYLGGKQLTLAEADALRQRLEVQGEPELAGKVAERLRAQAKDQARSFLAGNQPTFADADALWRRLKKEESPLTPAGIRRDFQQAIAELRTDLNRFTPDEGRSLMACGYRMAAHAFERDLQQIAELEHAAPMAGWPFAEQLRVITRPGGLPVAALHLHLHRPLVAAADRPVGRHRARPAPVHLRRRPAQPRLRRARRSSPTSSTGRRCCSSATGDNRDLDELERLLPAERRLFLKLS